MRSARVLGIAVAIFATFLERSATAAASEGFSLAKTGGPYHGDEMKVASGETWFALVKTADGFELRQVTLKVELVEDPVIDVTPGQKTGKQIGFESGSSEGIVVLLNSKNPSVLRTGKIDGKGFETGTGAYPGQVIIANVGQRSYSLVATGEAFLLPSAQVPTIRNYELRLVSGERSQVIYSKAGPLSQDAGPRLIWAGDVDRDGSLDLLVDLSEHYNVSRLTLFLSSSAKHGDLVEKVAELATTGC